MSRRSSRTSTEKSKIAQLSQPASLITVATDQADYQPGETAIFTASNLAEGTSVAFRVAHVLPGRDGLYGTRDDRFAYDLDGTGPKWSVTDGSAADLDGALNGVVVTSWFVNDDALGQTFRVSAIDAATGKTATALFTDAVPPNVSSAHVNLTTTGGSGTDGGVVYQQGEVGAGTGVFPAFVKIDNEPTEQGYNSDANVQQFDENNEGPHNHSILVSDLPVFVGDGTNGTTAGVLYYQFLLDAHESQGGDEEFISLDQLAIYQEAAGNLTGFENAANGFYLPAEAGNANEYLVYNLDAGGDKWIAIDGQLSSGSGNSDMALLIPVSYFSTNPNLQYVYVYSQFGSQAGWSTSATPEEWALGAGEALGSISGTKFRDADGNLATTNDRTPLSGWTIYIDANGSNTLDAGDISTTTNASGNYSFDTLLAGTYTIREVVQPGYTQLSPLSPDEYTIVLDASEDSTGNNFINLLAQPSLNIVKNASVTGGTANVTSDVITYSYTLTNTGNVAISGITVVDNNATGTTSDDFTPTFLGGDADSDSQLDVGETWTYSATKGVTQAMLDAGTDIVNIVTADGSGNVDADTDDATVDVVQSKSLNILKDATVTGGTADATTDVITYSYTLTNTGNASIAGITVIDNNATPGNTSDDFTPTFVGGDADSDSQLDVSETWTYSATKGVTQAMLDAGTDIVNIVTADGSGNVDATPTMPPSTWCRASP